LKAIAKLLGIDEVRAEVWPEEKAKIVAELQEQGTASRWSATA